MGSWNFEPGRLYYLAELIPWAGSLAPHVSTWVFDGCSEMRAKRSACDSGEPTCSFSALCFDRGWKASSRKRVFADLLGAAGAMLSWDGLMCSVAELDKRLKALRPNLGRSDGGEFLECIVEAAATGGKTLRSNPDAAGGFRCEHLYYRIGFIGWRGQEETVVETYVFDGMVVPRCVSRAPKCSSRRVHQFSLVSNLDGERPERGRPVHFRQARLARESFRSWEEFRVSGETVRMHHGNRRQWQRPAGRQTRGTARASKLVWTDQGDEAVGGIVGSQSIRHITISSRKISGRALANLQTLPNLEVLEFRRRPVSVADLTCLRALSRLRALVVSDCLLSNSAMCEISAARSLRGLYLWNCRLPRDGLAGLVELHRLNELSLSRSQIDDNRLSYLSRLKNLRTLQLHQTEVTDAGMVHLSVLSKLSSLELRWTNVTDAGTSHLQKLSCLVRLDLSFTVIGDQSLDLFQKLTALKDINLRGTRVTDEGVNRFRKRLPDCGVLR